MKPFRIVIGILAVAFLLLGANLLKKKLDFDRDGKAIESLTAEYKAMGIPTNGAELVTKVPDDQNAWLEIEPHLIERTPNGAKMLFRSSIPLELMMTCGEQDLGLIEKYLAENAEKRSAIELALQAKPKLQVTHDYDEGYMMLLPEIAAIRPLIREYCLAAYCSSLKGDLTGAKKNLILANRFASNFFERPEFVAAASGASSRMTISMCALRIAEEVPPFASAMKNLVSSPEFQTSANKSWAFQSEFIAQLSIPRSFDSPEFDRPHLPTWLKGIGKTPDEGFFEKQSKVHHGDYIPNSPTMRAFLRNRLESWKPFFTDFKNGQFPTVAVYNRASNMALSVPKQLLFLVDTTSPNNDLVYYGLTRSKRSVELNNAIWSAIQLKEKTGRYPSALSDLNQSFTTNGPEDVIDIESTKNSIILRPRVVSTFYDDPLRGLSFPAIASIPSKTVAEYRQKVDQYRQGEIRFDGSMPKGAPRGTIVVPPGAPRPVP